MGFLDRIFGDEADKVPDAINSSIPDDFDAITVEPDEPEIKPQVRPPVIFENGII
ncbi:MAG: hypothetical protein R3F48_00075 [Candidatus Zixiibacteriota bacterium]